jgi:hypothetical protein
VVGRRKRRLQPHPCWIVPNCIDDGIWFPSGIIVLGVGVELQLEIGTVLGEGFVLGLELGAGFGIY